MTDGPALTAVLSGGAMGDDPFDPRTWSGTSLHLLEALKRAGALDEAFGLSLPKWQFALLAISKFSPDREVWRRRTYRSRAYRSVMTWTLKQAVARRVPAKAVLQLGAYVDGPAAYPGVPVLTYQDGAASTYDDSPYVPAALRNDKKLRAEAIAFEREVARGAAKVLTTSQWLADRMTADYGLEPGHAVNVGCGVAAEVTCRPEDHDYASKELLFIGVEFDRKGGPELLDAFAAVRESHPEARLHLVGPKTAPTGSDAPGVEWHGFLDRKVPDEAARFDELMRRASLFVLPSRYEPFGLAPIEAMANGVPAVVTGEWALAENIRDGIDGAHVPMGDKAALARTLSELLGQPDRLRAMGEAAADTPARQSWDDVAARIQEQARQALAD